jgi:hypothetical protein
MVCTTGSLNILSLCHRRSSDVSRIWTIGLTAIVYSEAGLNQDAGLLASSMMFKEKGSPFRASGNTVPAGSVTGRLSGLSVKGYQIMTIAFPIAYLDITAPESWEEIISTKFLWVENLKFLSRVGAYETHENRQRALWNTMVGTRDLIDNTSAFQTWCSWLESDVENCRLWNTTVLSQTSGVQ